MQLQQPFRVVTPTVDGDILAVLAGADAEFTPPQVHGLAQGGWSEEGVRKSLRRLSDQGIVLHRRAGMAGLYRLNRQHLAAPAIIALASLRIEFLERLRERVAGWSRGCRYAALFGSAARGEMRPDSDIDIFIVRPDGVDADDAVWRGQLDALATDATAWTGNDARILEYGDAEARAGIEERDPVLLEIATDGIRLTGRANYLRPTRRR